LSNPLSLASEFQSSARLIATAIVKAKLMILFFISDNLGGDWLPNESCFTTNTKSEWTWLEKPTGDIRAGLVEGEAEPQELKVKGGSFPFMTLGWASIWGSIGHGAWSME
jgi:hypothetical protein